MWLLLLSIAVALFVIVATAVVLHFLSFVFRRRYIPGVPIANQEQHWFWGLGRLVMPIDGVLDSHFQLHRLTRKYGPLFQFYVLWNHVLHITDGQLAKTVMEKVARGKGTIHRRDKEAKVKNILGINTNDDWRRRRNKFRHAFTLPSLRGYSAVMHGQVQRLLAYLRKTTTTNNDVAIDAIYSRFALDAIFQLGFELDERFLEDAAHFDAVNAAIQDFFQLVWLNNVPFFRDIVTSSLTDRVLWLLPEPVRRYRRAFFALRDLRRRVLRHLRDKHRDRSFQSDCFGKLLMEFADAEEAAHTGLSETDLESELMVFMIAGHETTAHSLSFLTYALARHPPLFRRCQTEVRNHLASTTNTNNNPYSVLTPLPEFVEACVKESMRKYPVAARGSMRVQLAEDATDTHNADGAVRLDVRHLSLATDSIAVPRDTIFHVNIFSLHNDERLWGADAALFRPDRWLATASSDPSSSNAPSDASSDAVSGVDSSVNCAIADDAAGAAASSIASVASSAAYTSLGSAGAYAGATVSSCDAQQHQQQQQDQQQGRDLLVFMPFSHGPRNCIGMNFALWELRSVLCALLAEAEALSLPPESLAQTLDEAWLLQTDMITMKPHAQLTVRLVMRQQQQQQ